ncbi:MAG: hypothetical protein BWY50_02154 [Spirochaetes bacterium ADurb.Bin315]|nr:MAG: hypothetical protein BWY50_02154 [Spirochaetes bacterium ADurb.Bin315]
MMVTIALVIAFFVLLTFVIPKFVTNRMVSPSVFARIPIFFSWESTAEPGISGTEKKMMLV